MPRNLLAQVVHRVCDMQVHEHRREIMRKKKANLFRHPVAWLSDKWRALCRKLNW